MTAQTSIGEQAKIYVARHYSAETLGERGVIVERIEAIVNGFVGGPMSFEDVFASQNVEPGVLRPTLEALVQSGILVPVLENSSEVSTSAGAALSQAQRFSLSTERLESAYTPERH